MRWNRARAVEHIDAYARVVLVHEYLTVSTPSFPTPPSGGSSFRIGWAVRIPTHGCGLLPASSCRHQIINGYHVLTDTTQQGTRILADNADGLSVYIFTPAGTTPNALAIFAHHLRLLGPDPAHWTTQWIG